MFDIRVAGRLSDTDGGGEEQFKEYLRTALSDDYIAILGAVISASPEDRRNQIDALIIGPPGVFLLDVKNWSGRWSGDAKHWYRYGSIERRDSPISWVSYKWEHFRKWLKNNPEPCLAAVHASNVWVDYGIVLTHPTCDTTALLDHCKSKYLIRLNDFSDRRFEASYRTSKSKRLGGYLEARLIADKIFPSRECDILAIDFGTSYSSVATYTLGNQPVVFRDKFNNSLIPTVFGYQNNKTYVGQAAKQALSSGQLMYRNYVASLKTYLGMSDEEFDSFKSESKPVSAKASNDGLVIRLDGKSFLATDIAGQIIKYLRDLAELRSNYPWYQAVISVPARAGQQYRSLIRDAAKRIAGFSAVFLVDEPSAAAMAYGMFHDYEGCLAVFDMGGGTFDFSVLEIKNGRFTELVKLGELIGGDNFDGRLYDDVLTTLRQSDILDVNTPIKDRQRYRLIEEVRRLKETLSGQADGRVFLDAWHNGRDALKEYQREDFEVLITDRVNASIEVCRKAINEVPNLRIDDVVLVGGSTLVPIVYKRVGDFFKLKPKSDIDPNLAVIQGVALRAGMYMGRVPGSYLMTRVSEVTIGTLAAQVIAEFDKSSNLLFTGELPEGCYDKDLANAISALRQFGSGETSRFRIAGVLRSNGVDSEAIEAEGNVVFVTKYNIVDPIISRNDRIEEEGKIKDYPKTLLTNQDGQKVLLLELWEAPAKYRGWAKADDCKRLLQREVHLQAAAAAGQNGVSIILRFDRDGRVELEFQELLAPSNRDIFVINFLYNADARRV
jgi:molecular chaperone DnaK (HSP70)